jgi:Ricin-type beta-trefoil lectin domain-like
MLKRLRIFTILAAVAIPLALSVVPAHAADTDEPVVFQNEWEGKCADLPYYGAPAVDAPVTQYTCNFTTSDNQIWYMQPTRTVNGNQLYQFQLMKGGQCLDLPNYGAEPLGTHVEVYPCASNPAADNQEWYLNYVSNAENGGTGYEIINYKDGLCLDVSGWAGLPGKVSGDNDNNLPLTVYPCYNSAWGNNGYDDHVWDLVAVYL